MLQKNTKVIAVMSGIFFIVSVVIFVLFILVVSKQKGDLRTQSIEREEIRIHQDSLVALMRTLESTKESRISLQTRILKEDDVIDLLSLIESLGREQRVTLNTNSLTVEPLDELFETLVIQVNVEGSYASIKHVLMLLEHLPYQTSLGTTQLTRGGGEKGDVWNGMYEVRVTKYKDI